MFNIGSPLGVFLVMRGIRPRDDIEQHIMPTSVCKRIFNIYDPSDPVVCCFLSSKKISTLKTMFELLYVIAFLITFLENLFKIKFDCPR